MRPENRARNEAILHLAKTMSPAQIRVALQAQYGVLTRNVIISVINRWGPKDEESRKNRLKMGEQARKDARAKQGRRSRTLGLAEPTAEQKAKAKLAIEAARERAKPPKPAAPAYAPPLPLRHSHYLDTPLPGSTPVPASERTGCVWPFGERQNITFCNLKRCRVSFGGKVETVNYCAEHWEARRASKTTRILADPV